MTVTVPAALYSWRMLSFVDNVPEGDFYLAALAVDGTRRGEGIGTVLLEHTLERARSAGSERIVL
jgi:predicted N-acetyltransferase YhbS